MERGQRRRYPRAKIEWPVSISTNRVLMERATLNVSPAGALIYSRNPLNQYEIFDLIISSPDRHIKTKAEVVWRNSHYASLGDIPHGMGVRFLKIQDSDRDYLTEMVSEYKKQSNSACAASSYR